MTKNLLIVAALVLMASATAHAGEGVPSNAKLSQLGLSSMNVVADSQGMEVRGEGMGILGGSFWARALSGISQNSGGIVVGNASPAIGSFGTIEPTTQTNVPFVASYATTLNGATLVITSSAYGNVVGFAN